MSGYGALAYVVQLNLPGGPLKIGHSRRVRERFHHFSTSTPVDLRFVGVTPLGQDREELMLAATKDNVIRGEWRLPTPELLELVGQWVAAGEWFIESGNNRRHFEEAKVAARAHPFMATSHHRTAPRGMWDAWRIAEAAGASDPSLLADWHGFARATEMPDFRWPSLRSAAA